MLASALQISTLNVGGRIFTDLVNLKHLIAAVSDATNKYSSFREHNGTAGYVVPANFQLRILALKITTVIAAAGTPVRDINLAYADNDSGVSSTTALTNGVYLGGSATFFGLGTIGGNQNPGQPLEKIVNFVVPTGKYSTIVQLGAGTNNILVQAFGYLEAV